MHSLSQLQQHQLHSFYRRRDLRQSSVNLNKAMAHECPRITGDILTTLPENIGTIL